MEKAEVLAERGEARTGTVRGHLRTIGRHIAPLPRKIPYLKKSSPRAHTYLSNLRVKQAKILAQRDEAWTGIVRGRLRPIGRHIAPLPRKIPHIVRQAIDNCPPGLGDNNEVTIRQVH